MIATGTEIFDGEEPEGNDDAFSKKEKEIFAKLELEKLEKEFLLEIERLRRADALNKENIIYISDGIYKDLFKDNIKNQYRLLPSWFMYGYNNEKEYNEILGSINIIYNANAGTINGTNKAVDIRL